MRRIVFLLSLLWISGAQAKEHFQLPIEGAFIFTPSTGGSLLQQCSRETPAEVKDFWTPSNNEIAALEKLLIQYMNKRQFEGKEVPPAGLSFHRQYIGYIHNGERLIYGNFYPAQNGHPTSEDHEPQMVCDGGSAFWGIVFNPRLKSFDMLRFNGAA